MSLTLHLVSTQTLNDTWGNHNFVECAHHAVKNVLKDSLKELVLLLLLLLCSNAALYWFKYIFCCHLLQPFPECIHN
jgi:hypothetical protein